MSTLCIFMGGTCNGSSWRDRLINSINITANVKFFNPVVDKWTEAHRITELRYRASSDKVLYVITPKMMGVYSIAEAVDDSNKRPDKTMFCYLEEDEGSSFTPEQIKSLEAVKKLIKSNGGMTFESFTDLISYFNTLN